MSKGVLYGLLSALVLSNGLWLYNTMDQAAALDGCFMEVMRYKKSADVLATLIIEYPRGEGVDEVRAEIIRKHPDWIVKMVGDRLQVEGITLEFRENRIVRAIPALE
jgi:hypothetical protein